MRIRSASLLEITVALALAVILLLGLFFLTASTSRARNFTRERDLAREAARAKLEEIMASEFDAIEETYFTAGGPTFFTVGLPPHSLISAVPGEAPGKITIDTAKPPAAPGSTGLKRVVVEVRWKGQDQQANRMELSAYVARREP